MSELEQRLMDNNKYLKSENKRLLRENIVLNRCLCLLSVVYVITAILVLK